MLTVHSNVMNVGGSTKQLDVYQLIYVKQVNALLLEV